jgi:predicted AlkP superfamily phosphohydrolase/phosphomutase
VRRRYLLSLALLILFGAVLADGAVEQGPARRVVLVSLDGAADWLVDDFLARGVLPPDGALAQMSRTGIRAEAMTPVDPSVTSPSHVAMFTGAYPERTGVVSNTFLPRGNPITKSVSGFSAPIHAETLWQTARRQGKRVVCATAVGADLTAPERTCDVTLAYGRSDGPAAVVRLAPAPDGSWELGDQRFEHMRSLEARPESPAPLAYHFWNDKTTPLYALAVDSVFDGSEQYDELLLDFDHDLGNGLAARLTAGKWATVLLELGPPAMGSSVKLLALEPDLSKVVLYLGSPSHARTDPAAFTAELEKKLGPWPGDPDGRSLEERLIDEDLWIEQAARLSHWLRDTALEAMHRDDWNLFLTYLPLIDETEHTFLLRDPRQPGYDDGQGTRRIRYNSHVEWAYQTADHILQDWMAAAPTQTVFIVVSDHGHAPLHTLVDVHAVLRQAGFRVVPDETTQVRAYPSSATANVYVNLAGRQEGGVVPADQLDDYIDRMVTAFKGVTDPVSGQPVFEAVYTRPELERIHLYNPEATGDVWLSAAPGFKPVAGFRENAPVFALSKNEYATHGYLSSQRKMQAIFFAAGGNLKPRWLGTVRGVDVAPTVAALLGLQPPAGAQGRNVLATGP